MTRIDKILSTQLNISRTDAKQLIRQKRVAVNGVVVNSGDLKVDEASAIAVDGKAVVYNEHLYIMMNKPQGVISASDGKGDKTVIDLVPKDLQRKGLFPAGRLDKDTTGFVLITDDGDFAHYILSPAHHIDKTYIAHLDKPFDQVVVDDFKGGMVLNGEDLLEADISPMNDENTIARVVLRQGLYHQVKRMFKKHGITVTQLKRIKMGNLPLDEALAEGECRQISQDELNLICGK